MSAPVSNYSSVPLHLTLNSALCQIRFDNQYLSFLLRELFAGKIKTTRPAMDIMQLGRLSLPSLRLHLDGLLLPSFHRSSTVTTNSSQSPQNPGKDTDTSNKTLSRPSRYLINRGIALSSTVSM
ncbi:hypothetical protein PV04_05020 [Phialophora macrospora]|uniref:Uncharacterized protein n=1 Tax=Phialophora macrospora TaxID=1851006 RepID=A0A0D2E450_9EURO|nr:hypothetical protein PV04_05020 [Phialophora macrospora]